MSLRSAGILRSRPARATRCLPFLVGLLLLARAAAAGPPVVLAVPAEEEATARYKQWRPLVELYGPPEGGVPSGSVMALTMTPDHAALERGLRGNLYDVAFVDPSWYLRLAGQGLCVALARPILQGRGTDRTLLIVHRDSILRSVSDLAQRTIALTAPGESAVGYFLPLALLRSGGLSVPGEARIIYSDTFLSILKGVVYGKLEAGFVSATTLDDRRNASLREQVRVILESEAVPRWTVVARSGLRGATIASVRTWLLALGKSDAGRRALALSGFSGFVEASDSEYGLLRPYLDAVEAGFVPAE